MGSVGSSLSRCGIVARIVCPPAKRSMFDYPPVWPARPDNRRWQLLSSYFQLAAATREWRDFRSGLRQSEPERGRDGAWAQGDGDLSTELQPRLTSGSTFASSRSRAIESMSVRSITSSQDDGGSRERRAM